MRKGQKIETWTRDALTLEEIDAIVIACKSLEETYCILFLSKTGSRVNELLRSRKEWFKYERGLLEIPKKKPEEIDHNIYAKEQRPPKTKVDRVLKLDKSLERIAKVFFMEYPNGLLRSRQWVWAMVKQVAERSGITNKHVTPHIFRHSRITNLYLRTDLKSKEIGIMVGHTGTEMVEKVYTHMKEIETAERAAEQMGEV